MPRYLIQESYANQGISDLVKNPSDRAVVARSVIEKLGGKLVSADFAFGEYDAVLIVDLPDNVAMAAFSMAVGAGGAVRSFKTTVLIPMDEAVEAMRKAGTVGYRPPGR
jgi:uncharacterized protein with GYD domain